MTDLNDPRKGGVSSASLTDALGRLSTLRAYVLDLVSPTPGAYCMDELSPSGLSRFGRMFSTHR